LILFIKIKKADKQPEQDVLKSIFAGISFIRLKKVILGAISLDLFAVLLGGATAMLPVYARDILKTGPIGLGILRSAPAAGALVMSLILSWKPLRSDAGKKMFAGVAVFGASTIVFAVSRQFWLSMAALLVMGAADVVSVVVRSTLVQLKTPDNMRGRVNAVNSLFIGTSNQLGEFESGITASWFGVVPAVVIGGIGTLVIVAAWIKIFPELYNADNL
jgi:predicted MFS family arabinose efflux permease